MKRWIVVDWETRTVFEDAFDTKRHAWRAIVERAQRDNRSTNEFDEFEVSIEAR